MNMKSGRRSKANGTHLWVVCWSSVNIFWLLFVTFLMKHIEDIVSVIFVFKGIILLYPLLANKSVKLFQGQNNDILIIDIESVPF